MTARVPWRERAACRGEDPELFFSRDAADKKAAKLLCRDCPVWSQCLRDVMRTELPSMRFGVRAGLTARERDRLWRARQKRQAAA